MHKSAHLRVGETVIGLFTLGIGLFLAVDTWRAPPSPAQAVVGPGLFPVLIAIAMGIVGLQLLWEGYLHRYIHEEVPDLDWMAVGIVATALASQIFLLEPFGWIICGAAVFTVSAMAFCSRRYFLNLIFGLALSSVTYLVFDYGLDLDLPTGTLIEDVISPTE